MPAFSQDFLKRRNADSKLSPSLHLTNATKITFLPMWMRDSYIRASKAPQDDNHKDFFYELILMMKNLDAPRHSDEFWMRKSLHLAKKAAEQDEVPVGAILVVDNHIISKSFNKKEQWRTPIGHAEVICVHRASQKLDRWRLSDATLYVTLEPCVMCAGMLVQSRIGRLVYGTKDPKGGGIHSLYQLSEDSRLNHRFEVTSGVLAEECGKILSDFFKQRRKRPMENDTDRVTKKKPT